MDTNSDPVYIARRIEFLKEQIEALGKISLSNGDYREKLKELGYWRNRQIQINKKYGSLPRENQGKEENFDF